MPGKPECLVETTLNKDQRAPMKVIPPPDMLILNGTDRVMIERPACLEGTELQEDKWVASRNG